VKTRLVTAGVGAAWEAALVQACQAGQVGAQVLHRCYDLGDLLAVAAAGQAEVAVVAAGTRWLDRDALARLAAAGLAVVGVAAAGDEDSERRLRQLGLLHIASDADPPDTLVDRARAALAAEPDPGDEPPEPDEVPAPPDGETRRILAAVWGPKGGPGRTTVAVNLAFEAAAVGGEVLLVDADTYGGAVAHATIHEHHRNLSRQSAGTASGPAGTGTTTLLNVLERQRSVPALVSPKLPEDRDEVAARHGDLEVLGLRVAWPMSTARPYSVRARLGRPARGPRGQGCGGHIRESPGFQPPTNTVGAASGDQNQARARPRRGHVPPVRLVRARRSSSLMRGRNDGGTCASVSSTTWGPVAPAIMRR
jgi:AAA domain